MQTRITAWVVLLSIGIAAPTNAGPNAEQAAEAGWVGVSLESTERWRPWDERLEDGEPRTQRSKLGTPLGNEMIRQALLIAARDELGLRTYDAMLGEPTRLDGVAPISIELDFIKGKGTRARLGMNGEPLAEVAFNVFWRRYENQQRGLEEHEAFSRGKAVALLRDAGMQGEPNRWHDAAPVPESTQALVDTLGLVEQFRAARALHQLMGEDGESPERLWALSRVYAQLAQETRWFMRCQYSVFQARSLLYARRLQAKAPEHPLGRLAVAYAWMFAGHPNWAKPELDWLNTLGKDDRHGVEPWVNLLNKCYEHNTFGLWLLMDDGGPIGDAAALWRVYTNETCGIDAIRYNAVTRAVAVNPHSIRLHHGAYGDLNISGGVLGPGQKTAAKNQVSFAFRDQLGQALLAVDDAPAGVADLLPGIGDLPFSMSKRAAFAEDLLALPPADDGGELSYAVLGTLIQEANFLHLYMGLVYTDRLNTVGSVERFFRQAQPYIKDHPVYPVLLNQLFGFPGTKLPEGVTKPFPVFKPQYLNPYHAAAISKGFGAETQVEGIEDWPLFWIPLSTSHAGGVNDIQRMHPIFGGNKRKLRIGEMDPHNPNYIAARLAAERLTDEGLLKLAMRYGAEPIIADALSKAFEKRGDFDAARDYATLIAHIAPDVDSLEQLATNELRLGNEDNWLSLMERSVELSDSKCVRRAYKRIIYAYFKQRRFEDAMVYSEKMLKCCGRNVVDVLRLNIDNLVLTERYEEAFELCSYYDKRFAYTYVESRELALLSYLGIASYDIQSQRLTDWHNDHRGDDFDKLQNDMVLLKARFGRHEDLVEQIAEELDDVVYGFESLAFGVVSAQHIGDNQARDRFLDRMIEQLKQRQGNRSPLPLAEMVREGIEAGGMDWPAVDRYLEERRTPFQMERELLWLTAIGLERDREKMIDFLTKRSKGVLYPTVLTAMYTRGLLADYKQDLPGQAVDE